MTKYVIVFVSDGRVSKYPKGYSEVCDGIYNSEEAARNSFFLSGISVWTGCYYLFTWDDATNEIRCEGALG